MKIHASAAALIAAAVTLVTPQAPPAAWELEPAIARALPGVVEQRRDIHRHPELGEQETRTAGIVAARLTALGLEVRTGVAVTGVVGILRGGLPGRTVAWRADMDALPVTEQTGLPFASTAMAEWEGKEVGVMHACGHDVHTAIGLGLAEVLAGERARLPGTVVFLFQPAEEGMPDSGSHGARRMVELGVLADPRPEAVLGLHVDPALAVGQVSIVPRGALAAVDRFTITVRGRQAHGAYPHTGVDPIVAASQIVLALQTIASRNVDTHETVVVSVCEFSSGNRFNILPAEARLLGTIRTHDEAVRTLVHTRLREIAEQTAAAHAASAAVEVESITPVTFNDEALAARLRPSFVAVLGAENVVDQRPHMGGEDFAFFAREVPGLFYFLGTSDFGKGQPALVHTPFFDPDERCLEVGLRASARVVWDFLASQAP